MRSTDPAVQVKATEALGDAVNSENDVSALVSLARSHSRAEVRREAIETLGNVHEESAVGALIAIARNDAYPELRRAAIEALGDQHNAVAFEALRSIALGNGPEHARVRRRAVEILSER